MADVNAPSGQTPTMAPPVRADDQILPHIRWVPIGKSNCYLDLEKSQSNPIYKIAVDLLKNTNFFRAFTASSNLPSIYIQQFWDTILYDKKARCYKCQLDEQWFDLTKETLREALQITPVNRNQAFAAPPSIDGLIDFVNQLGYPKLEKPLDLKDQGPLCCRFYEALSQEPILIMPRGSGRNLPNPYILLLKTNGICLGIHQGNKRATLIVIPSIWFTKLVIHHLQRKHRFYPRPDSLLHLSNEEPVLGYLKFSAKAPAKSQENKRKQAIGTTDKPAKAKRIKRSISCKTRQPRGSPKSVGASEAEEVPAKEPQVADEDADYQKAVEESMKDAYALPKDSLPPLVIREPESRKYQPLPEVPRKGKAKVTEEQVAHDLLSLQKHKKTSPADQYIFQRRVSEPTASSFHDESPYEVLGQSDSKEESKKIALGVEKGGQDEGQAGLDPDAQAEDQTGSDAGAQAKGQAGPDPGNAKARVQSTSSPMVHAGSDREHMDLDVANVSPQPSMEQLDEGFTPTVYPNIQENLKLSVEEPRIGELEHILADLIQVNKTMEERLDKHGARLYTLEQLDIPQHVSIAKRKKGRESPKTPPGSSSHQPPPPPPPAGPSGTSEAPRASGSQVTPPPPPPTSTNQDSPSKGSAAPSPSKTAATTEHQAWTTPDVTLKPLISLTPADLDTDEAMGPDEQAQLSDEEDVGSAHFLTRRGITKLKPQDLEGPDYEIVKVFHPDVIHLQYQMEECHKLLTDSMDDPILRHNVSKPLPLGGPPGQVIIQSDFFFNKDLEYLRYGCKSRRLALSISKIKAAYYPDAGLEQMVPDQFWIEEECKYDIAAMYGISHWWFQRQRFYIDRHTSEDDRSTVRTHMRILSVVRIEVFFMYGYDYMKKIVLRRADLNEHVIAEQDFKYLYPSDFEDLNLLNLQGHLNHLPPKDKKILTTAVNQWTRQLVILQRVEDFQLGIESYQSQMMMRFNEIHKFSDGTLQQIVEALDYRVKEFRINKMNPGLNTRFWTRKDVDQCNTFMFAIQRRLRTRRIFHNLKSFVGGCIREGDYRLLRHTD
nr:hypothetical protein [Tanacetum cinerariifolium]